MKSIQINHVTKQFKDVVALNDVSLRFEHGKIYGLLGRNGAGKSTLLNIISNRLFADNGEVTIDGMPAMENDKAQQTLYMMSEKQMYPKTLKIKEIFHWTKEFYGSFDDAEAQRLAKMFELNINKKVKELSTGYNSIFKLIIALCLDVSYVFFDEPVLGLDAYHRELFYKILLESYEKKPRTMIIATHLIEEVANLVEDIIIIDSGKVLLEQSVEDVLASGYSISGRGADVDSFTQGKKVIGQDSVGSLKTAYVIGKMPESTPATLELSRLNLQKLFVELTKKENEL